MDELNKALKIAVTGPLHDAVLATCQKQMALWKIAMPAAQPLVLDLGLGDFPRAGLIEYWIANESKSGYCGKYLFVFDGQTCPTHRHVKKHETFFVVKGQVRVNMAGQERILREGDVLPVPPGVKHSFTGIGPALLLELSMPCEVDDNCFDNQQIPIGSNYRPQLNQ